MVTPPDDLDALAGHIIQRLAAATADPAAPWRTPMLASLGPDSGPTLRTVVLRSVQPERRAVLINTDSRSDKAGQIRQRPQVEFCFWDPEAAQQLRIAGDAVLDTDGAGADLAWSGLPPEGRAIYRSASAPGTPADGPGSPASTALDGDDGRQAFALVTVTWRRWDWIWLGPQAHWRARFHWQADGSPRSSWVVP